MSESKNSSNTGGSPSVSECSEGRYSTLLLKSFSKWANQSYLVMPFVAGGFLLCFLIWFQKACGSLATLSNKPVCDLLWSSFLPLIRYLYFFSLCTVQYFVFHWARPFEAQKCSNNFGSDPACLLGIIYISLSINQSINCLLVLIISVCGIVVFICVCSMARTGC